VGEFVLLSTKNLRYSRGLARKFLPRFVGPFEIVRTIDKGDETVAAHLFLPPEWNSRIHPVFHVSLLRPYHAAGAIQPPPLVSWELSDAPKLERIMDHRSTRTRVTSYYVKWLGTQEYYTWEPVASVTDEHVLQVYWDSVAADQQHLRPPASQLPSVVSNVQPDPVPQPELVSELPVAPVSAEQLPSDPGVDPEFALSPAPSVASESDGGESVARGWVACNPTLVTRAPRL